MFSFTHGFSRVIDVYGSIRKPFKRFRFEFVFGATWLKPGVNEIKSAAIVSGLLRHNYVRLRVTSDV
jgi:hypothetical protein